MRYAIVDDLQSLKVQNGALRTMVYCLEEELKFHREQARKYHVAIRTLDSEKEMNRLLTEENERLRG